MLQLIYTSSARVPFTGVDMSRLLLKARVNNDLVGITGMLLWRTDAFMQLLEGEESVVEELFSRILADPRHGAIQVLRRVSITENTFPGWSMGFAHFEKGSMDEPAGLEDFFETKGRPTSRIGEAALQLLSRFRYVNWRRHVDRGYAPVTAR